jgi:peptidyl-prolyl cis-trans isomerase D
MFDFVRNHQRFFQFVLALLVLPSFAFFGVQGYNRTGDGDNLATIGQQNVSQKELDTAVRSQLDKLKQYLGANYDEKQFDTPAAREMALNGLINQKVVALEAQRDHLSGSDDKLRDIIKTLPGVLVDGKFDEQAYKRFTAGQGFTSTDGFEAKLRQDIGLQSITNAFQGSTTVSKGVVDKIGLLQERTVKVQELAFKPESYADKITLDPAAVEKYYAEQRKQFEIPERANIEYVVFDQASVAKSIVIPEAELKTYYEGNKARLGTPEERQASHILIKVDAKASDKEVADAKTKAQSLMEQAKKDPAQFAKLAADNSQDAGSAAQGGDLGFFKREAMVKAFSDVAFLLKEGEISPPVKSEFGWHVIRLTGIKAANIKPFDAVKTELEQELKTQQASKKFAEQSEAFSTAVYDKGDSFKEVAQKYKLDVKTADGITREAMVQAGKTAASLPAGQPANPNALPFNEKLASILFASDALKDKKNSEATEVAKGSLVSARMLQYTPAKVLSLAEVKATVEAQLRQSLAVKLAQSEGETKLKALQAKPADAVDGLAAAKDISKQKPEGLSADGVSAVLRASSQTLPAWVGATQANGQYVVYKVLSVGAEAKLDEAKRNQLQNAIQRVYGEQELQSVMSVLRDRHGAKIIKKPVAADASKPV